jgi:hypothetical protein
MKLDHMSAKWHCRIGKITWKIAPSLPTSAAPSRVSQPATPTPAFARMPPLSIPTSLAKREAPSDSPSVAVDERAHLQPGWVSPAMERRTGRQQWANWVREWNPMSSYGKAAKTYSRAWSAFDRGKKLNLHPWVYAAPKEQT